MLVTALIGVFATVSALIMTGGNMAAKTGNAKIWALLTALCFTATTGALTLMLFTTTPHPAVPGPTPAVQQNQNLQNLAHADQSTVNQTNEKQPDTNSLSNESQTSSMQQPNFSQGANSMELPTENSMDKPSAPSVDQTKPAAASGEAETGQFLVDVLQALKNGQPIPEKWSGLLQRKSSN